MDQSRFAERGVPHKSRPIITSPMRIIWTTKLAYIFSHTKSWVSYQFSIANLTKVTQGICVDIANLKRVHADNAFEAKCYNCISSSANI